jgi:hypothetical protein
MSADLGFSDRVYGLAVGMFAIGYVLLAASLGWNGVAVTVFYFSLATFFAVNAKALQATQKVAENGNENAEDKSKPGRVGQGNPGLWPRGPISRKR